MAGITDYSIGFGKGMDMISEDPPNELNLAVTQANNDWVANDFLAVHRLSCYSIQDKKGFGDAKVRSLGCRV